MLKATGLISNALRVLIRTCFLSCLLCLSVAGFAASEPLPPDQAYRLSAKVIDEHNVEVRIVIEKGYYLYRSKFGFAIEPGNFSLGQPSLPEGLPHKDNFFGEQPVYRDSVSVVVPVQGEADKPFTLTVSHQGCADMGICYPPSEVPVQLDLKTGSSFPTQDQQKLPDLLHPKEAGLQSTQAETTELAEPALSQASAALAPEEDSNHIARLLRGGNLALIVVSFFGFGLLLAFTPCVLPMVPIISGLIVGHGHHISRGRAFALSGAYVMGMAFTYTAAGIAAGLSGTLLSAALQNVWVLGAFALLFVLLALAMFDVYTLQLPASLQHRLTHSANHHRGSLRQLAIMGALSALIVGPCVAAPLAGALLYIAQTGSALIGGSALFCMALGMGAPLMVIGVAARHWLPTAGPWMDGVKRFFGLLLLATALWLVSPVLPGFVPMLGWSVLLITSGVFLRAIDPLPPGSHNVLRLFKALGILALLAGAAIFIGALAGSRNPLQPLAGLRAAARAEAAETVPTPRFERIKTVADLDARIAASGKPVMLDFYADWCVSCKEMEHNTFTDPAIARQLAGFTLVQADVTANNPDDKALLARFSLFGPPGILFFPVGGTERKDLRVIGYVPPERFTTVLTRAQQP